MPIQDREARMKFLVIAAALVISTSALAKNGGGSSGHSGSSGPGMSMSHPASGMNRPGVRRGDMRGGGRRHFYRGRWWDYGVGPCWRPTAAGYIWICG
jgi:hypothetical protein